MERRGVTENFGGHGDATRLARRFPRGTIEVEPAEPKSDRSEIEHDRMLESEVAEIVHDLKNPLSAITLEAMLLEDKIARGDRSGGVHSIARINRNVAFLDRLVLDLLDVCALAAGHLYLYREPTDLRALLRGVSERLGYGRIALDANDPLTLMIDPLRVERVVANLIDNALKYTPSASDIVLRLTALAEGARVSVIDNGPGIAPSELAYVFHRYRRGAPARTTSGCGLGLYVCKRIVEAHGGQIGVESSVGGGTHFFFDLPAT
jgi:signal transduction histidine kinase